MRALDLGQDEKGACAWPSEAQAGLKVTNISEGSLDFLPPPQDWDYKCMLSCAVYLVLGIKPRAAQVLHKPWTKLQL